MTYQLAQINIAKLIGVNIEDPIMYAMWWVPKEQFPTIENAIEKLNFLQKNGSSEIAFDFKTPFQSPKE